MAITFGFYNSVGGDRVYNAVQMSSIFDGVITDGVFEAIGTSFVVRESSGMNVIIGAGRAWFDHTWTVNDADLVLGIGDAHPTLLRIDVAVIDVDASNAVRSNSVKIIAGTPASSPVPPDLIDTEEKHQYSLAQIYVGAGVTSIYTADITNTVGTYLCPFVTVPMAGGGGGGAAVLETQVFS